jgi:hypothetical protein
MTQGEGRDRVEHMVLGQAGTSREIKRAMPHGSYRTPWNRNASRKSSGRFRPVRSQILLEFQGKPGKSVTSVAFLPYGKETDSC